MLSLEGLLANELAKSQPHHFILIQIRRGEDLLVGNDSEIGNGYFIAIAFKANGLDCVSADFNAPRGFRCCHWFLSSTLGLSQRRRVCQPFPSPPGNIPTNPKRRSYTNLNGNRYMSVTGFQSIR